MTKRPSEPGPPREFHALDDALGLLDETADAADR